MCFGAAALSCEQRRSFADRCQPADLVPHFHGKGALVIVGSIQDGIMNDPSTLYVKAMLDGVASVALASSLGLGVVFDDLLYPGRRRGLGKSGYFLTSLGCWRKI